MKRRQIIKIGAMALLGGLAGSVANAADTITIGDMNAYTRLANVAMPYKQGLDLGIKEINAAGGVLGKQLKVVSRDTQGKPGVAIKIAEEMISRDGAVMIIGTTFSHIGIALASYAKKTQSRLSGVRPLGRCRDLGKRKRLYLPLALQRLHAVLDAGCRSRQERHQALGDHRAEFRLWQRGGRGL